MKRDMKTSHPRNSQAPGKVEALEDRPISQIWRSQSPIQTFVRCLRLLDLDRLEDWPNISERTFSTKPGLQKLQQRIKAVEWSLYRLFERYDSNETVNVS